MNLKKRLPFLSAAVGIAYLGLSILKPVATYDLDQAQRAVITQGGEVRGVDNSPGLGFYFPVVQSVHPLTTKLIDYRAEPQDPAVTLDKKTIQIDFYAMFRVANPVLFFQKARTEESAQKLVDGIVYSEMKNMVSKEYTFAGVVAKGDEIQSRVKDIVVPKLRDYGIEIVDVRLTIANPTEAVLESIYNRMITERLQKAQQYLSEGTSTKMKLVADAGRDETRINSLGYKRAEAIKGQGDAEALGIIQDAYGRDPDLAFFMQWLSTLEETTGNGDTLILSTESEIYRLLKEGKVK